MLPYPIVIKPASRFEYYEKKEGFSIMGMIQQNKMILFMVGGIVFAMGMPKLLVGFAIALISSWQCADP